MPHEERDIHQFDYEYEKVFSQIGGIHPDFTTNSKIQMAQIVEAIARGNEHIDAIIANKQPVPVKSGFIAEEFHAETFNIDAIVNGEKARAYTDNYHEWHINYSRGKQLGKYDVADVVISEGNTVVKDYQLKYLKTAKETAGALSNSKYEVCTDILGPSDQIDGIQ